MMYWLFIGTEKMWKIFPEMIMSTELQFNLVGNWGAIKPKNLKHQLWFQAPAKLFPEASFSTWMIGTLSVELKQWISLQSRPIPEKN